jgi:hypothetical protein
LTQVACFFRSTSTPITLGNLSVEQLMILGKHGLRGRYPKLFSQYDQQMSSISGKNNPEARIQEMKERIRQEKPLLKRAITLMMWKHYARRYP